MYFLQNIREALPDGIIYLINFIADIPAGFIAIIIMSIIYWCFSKTNGKILIGAYTLSYFINGLLKVTACVYRPWIKDSRLHVASIAQKGATGYSFPSGHATQAGSLYTSLAYLYGKKAKFITPICIVLILFTMFARIFLGAHTPQDVIIGAITGVISIFIIVWISKYNNIEDRRLNTVLITTVIISIAAILYIILKPYPMDTDELGNLLADPAKMMKDSISGTGMFLGYVIGIYIDKRKVNFKDTNDKRIRINRLLVGIVCVMILYFICGKLAKILLGQIAGTFVEYTLLTMGITGVVPLTFKKLKLN